MLKNVKRNIYLCWAIFKTALKAMRYVWKSSQTSKGLPFFTNPWFSETLKSSLISQTEINSKYADLAMGILFWGVKK